MAFFTEWATWEQLVFILACAIVVTVLLGCVKVVHTHYKLRTYNAVAERDKTEGAMHRQMSQRRTRLQTRDDVPFGIRAMESGIEVDGVWVSRSNTPEPPSSRDTSTSSMWLGPPRTDFDVDLEAQNDSLPPSQPRWGSADGPATNGTDHSATRQTARSSKSQHPPSSYAKYTGHAETSYRASRPTSSIDSAASNASNRASVYPLGRTDSGGAASISAPDLIALPARQRQQSLDLDLMQTHRMSQAAETGQFAPRVRKADRSGDWTNSRPSSATNLARHSLRLRARSESPVARPATNTTIPAEHLQYPSAIESLPDAARRATLPDVTPFAQFCRTGPPSPRLESRRPSTTSSSCSAKGITHEGEAESASAPSSTAPVVAATVAGEVELVAGQPAQQQYSLHPSSEKRESSILRGHGSGFEILRPGTFAAERQRSGPPISLYNNGMPHARPNSTDSPRKLQRKRRSSEESSASGRSRLSML
ncbi:hypothetical protein BST61_g8860 [Cercospora zeina]